jgi:predicted flap endonuclease-1-like 5' DNA nuclease
VTAQSILLSIALQSSSTDYLLLFLFLIVAIIFFAIFYYWWRGVSDEDLAQVIEADAAQTSGPATLGEIAPVESSVSEDVVVEETVEVETAVVEPVDEVVVEAEAELVEEVVVEEPVAETESIEPEPVPVEPDDLKKIEGVGPKIEELLNNAGIQTYAQMAETDADQIKGILADAGSRYQMADPTSWPAQAKLAAGADWDGLTEFQDKLHAGRHVD